MRHTAYADIVHGKLHIEPANRFVMQEALLVWPDGPVTVTVETRQATRSAQANAYYWAVVVALLAEHTGYTPDDMHEVLKVKFLSKDVSLRRANGTVVGAFVIGGSTADLYSFEFYDYVERIRQWAFEALDVSIPPADPDWRAHAEQERGDHDRGRLLDDETGRVGGRDGGDGGAAPAQAQRVPRRARRLGDGSVVATVERPDGGADAD
jgi:hypothetical protein